LGIWDVSSVTERHVDIEQLTGPPFEGLVYYDKINTEGHFLAEAEAGTDLFTGHEFLVQVKADGSFSVTNLTLEVDIPPTEEENHWEEASPPTKEFEVFYMGEFDTLRSRSTAERVTDGTYDDYFVDCYILIGGMLIHFGEADPAYVPPDDIVWRITGHTEEDEGANAELGYAYIDSGLINGVTYYYDVTGYDFQPFSSPRTLENGIRGIPATPRSHATGLIEGSAYDVDHASGSSDGSVEVIVVEPDNVTGHEYEVGFYDGDPPLDWYLKDLETGDTVLQHMVNQSGNDDYPIKNGMVVKVSGPELAIASWEYEPSDNRWFTGVNWGAQTLGGGLDLGINFFGSEITPAQYVEIELRFSDTERQNGYRNTRPGYAHTGFFEIPFTAWDVTSEPERQINIAFVENIGSDVFDSTWNPDGTDLGGREYLFIMNSDYDPAGGIYDDDNWAPAADVLYAGWFHARKDEEGNDRTYTEGDIFRITPYFVNLAADKFRFKTDKKLVEEGEVNLDDIKVVPNPYIVRNIWERSRDYSVIAFTHLPDECTIRVYSLAGDHLITLEHDSPDLDGNENWDLLTKNRQKVAAGIYIYHVDSPYGEKIGKFAVIR
jgi:hypothetical protein